MVIQRPRVAASWLGKQEQTWRHKTRRLLTRFWNYTINCALKIWNFLFLSVLQAHSAAKVLLINVDIDLMSSLNLLKVIPNNQLCEWTLVWATLVQSLQLMLVKHRLEPATSNLSTCPHFLLLPHQLGGPLYPRSHANDSTSVLPCTRRGSCCCAWPVHVFYKMLSELWERSWAVCKGAATFFVIQFLSEEGRGCCQCVRLY